MKSVIIIGGGVSGFATGIYLQNCGYNTRIIEKNSTCGGACIGWERKGCYIDGCIHWLTGVNPKTELHKLWLETDFIQKDTEILYQNDITHFDFGEKSFTFYSDVNLLRKELTKFAPEDKKAINKLCKHIRRFSRIEPPANKPADMMNVFELLKVAFTMAIDYVWICKMSKLSCPDYAKRFKNPYLRDAIANFMTADYNFMSFLYMYGHISGGDGGIPLGGSLPAINRMKEKYLSLGGKIDSATEVEEIIVENDIAKGVTLKDGTCLFSDWVVSTAPIEHTLKTLLKDKYHLKKIDTRLKDEKTYPIYTYTTVIMKFNAVSKKNYVSTKVRVASPITLDKNYFDVTFRNYGYDHSLKAPDGAHVVQATISSNDDMFFWWDNVKKDGNYLSEKKKLAEQILQIAKNTFSDIADNIEVIDVVTPCTYQRYLNSRHGSFQGFVNTAKGKRLMQKGVIKGLKNFILGGQCLIQSGGLPTAVMTGRFSAQRICKADKKKFTPPQIK